MEVVTSLINRVHSSWLQSQASHAERVLAGQQPVMPYASPEFLLGANITYVIVTMLLYKLMQRAEKGFGLKPIIAVYNLTCVFAAGYVMVGIAIEKWEDSGTFACINGVQQTPACYRMSHLIWAFYIQKFWEFMDTWFFILRKSLRQVTFLHLFHHSSITIVVGMILPHDFCGDMYLPVFLNSFVHVLMYAHYFVTALGIQSWWRQYLTSLQLIQFMLISSQAIISYRRGALCGVPDWAKLLLVCYMGSMLFLFGNFFLRRYIIKSPNPIPPACAGVLKDNLTEERKFFSGVATLGKDGSVMVPLTTRFSRYFLDTECSIRLIYQLTAMGDSMPNLHVSHKAGGGGVATFGIAGGKPKGEVSWTITMLIGRGPGAKEKFS